MRIAHKINLSSYSLVLAGIPWFYAIFAELLIPAVVRVLAPLAYLCLAASILLALIVIFRKSVQGSVRTAWIALVLDGLYIGLVLCWLVATG